jgi:mannose-6-phosphate isomerase class I
MEWPCDELVRCEFFVIQRHQPRTPFSFAADDRFHVWMILEGQARIFAGDWSGDVTVGQTLLLPADREAIRVEPRSACSILDAFLP